MIVEKLKRRLRCAVMYIPITSFVLHLIAERGKSKCRQKTTCKTIFRKRLACDMIVSMKQQPA